MNSSDSRFLSPSYYFFRILTLIVGFVFLFSGFVKAVDPMGTMIKIQDYFNSFGWNHYVSYAKYLGFILFSFEFVVGAALILKIFPKFFHRLALLIILFMTPLSGYLYMANPISDCGCFGDAIKLSNGETFIKNLVLFVFVLLILRKSYIKSLASNRWFSSLGFIVVLVWIVGFGYYNMSHLPILDFRPYKVGVNISQLKQLPKNARSDEYDYGFIYRKNGEEKRFTLDDCPVNDSSWIFVRNDSKLIREGDHAEAEDFLFFSPDGLEKSDSLLSLRTPLFLVILHNLQHPSVETKELRQLVNFAHSTGSCMALISGAEHKENVAWLKENFVDMPDFWGDEVLLKTIIRSNPGYLLLHQGTIIGKWHAGDLPEGETLNKILKEMKSGIVVKKKNTLTLMIFIGLLILPIILIRVVVRNNIRKNMSRKINRYY